MSKAYREAIFKNPKFIIRRILRGIRTGEFFWDLYYGIKFAILPATGETKKNGYYAKDRWPAHDFTGSKITPVNYQQVKKKKVIPIESVI
jgi:hypothetical protein